MKVLVISATFPPVSSGGADYALRLCQKIAERGHCVDVLTSRIENVVNDPKITVHPIVERWTWSDLGRILDVVRSVNPDVVNLHFGGFLYNDHPMITFLPAILRLINAQIRFVTHVEAPIGARVYLWPRSIRLTHRIVCEIFRSQDVAYAYGTLLRDSQHVIVLSEEHGNKLKQIYPKINEKLVLIPPPPLMPIVELDRFTAKEKLSLGGKKVLVYLGYLYPGKGIETLLQSFKLARQNHKDLHLVIIGGSPEMLLKSVGRPRYADEMRALAGELGIDNQITWTGDFEFDSRIPSMYLRAADLAVMPWDWGVHLNNSSLAAAACHGLPIITTQSPSSEHVFIDKQNVYLCPTQNPQSVGSAIDDLIANNELCEKLAQGALNLANQWFSWDKAIDRTLELFAD